MLAGQLNQIIRISKAHRIISQSQVNNENANVVGGHLATSMVPIGSTTKKTISNSDVIKPKDNLRRKPMVETYSLLNDSDLLISKSYRAECELLKRVGLLINESDDVRVVKTRRGDIKSAMSLQKDNDGYVKTAHYIDVDKDGSFFKQGLARLATLPNSVSFKSSNIEIFRDEIGDGLIIK